MDVKSAIALMAKNPLVDFPWESTLIGLVNGFLSEEKQLDPSTASGSDIAAAIELLEPTIRDMVYASHIAPGQVVNQVPVPPPVVQTPAPPQQSQLTPAENNAAALSATRNTMFKMLGVVICIIALYWALTLKGGAEPKDVIELLKVAISMMSDKSSPDAVTP